MSTSKNTLTRASKFLSYVLRHRPDEIGLTLDANGWASVAELLDKRVREVRSSMLRR